MKIIRASDKVKIKIGDISVTVQPLSYAKRIEQGNFVKIEDGKEKHDYTSQLIHVVKNSVKDIDGVQDASGEKIVLEFDGDSLTDDCASDVIGILESVSGMYKNISVLAGSAGKDIGQIYDPETGKALDGAEIQVLPKTKAAGQTTS